MFTPSKKPPTLRIGIMRTSSIGDVVLATACVTMLRQLRLNTEITWLGSEPSLDLIRNSFPDIRCIEVKRGQALAGGDLVDSLADLHLFVDLQVNLRSQMLAKNLQKRLGIQTFSAGKMQVFRNKLIMKARLRGRGQVEESNGNVPVLQYQLALAAVEKALRASLPVESLDELQADQAWPKLHLPREAEEPWRKELRFARWLAVAPGAAHPEKRAPIEVVKEILTETIAMRESMQDGDHPGLLMLGDSKDRELATRLLATLAWPGPTMNLAGRLSLWESSLALGEVGVLLSNDTALAHIAEATGTPVGVLFGPTVEAFGFAPHLSASKAFSVTLGCRPCSKHGKASCRYGDRKCFLDLNRRDVAMFLNSHLGLDELDGKMATPLRPDSISEVSLT